MLPGFTDQHQSDGMDSVVSQSPDSVAITDTPTSSCLELAGVAGSPAFLSQVLNGVIRDAHCMFMQATTHQRFVTKGHGGHERTAEGLSLTAA